MSESGSSQSAEQVPIARGDLPRRPDPEMCMHEPEMRGHDHRLSSLEARMKKIEADVHELKEKERERDARDTHARTQERPSQFRITGGRPRWRP